MVCILRYLDKRVTFVQNRDAPVSQIFNIMLLLSVSEFRANVSKYLEMAMTEQVSIRSKAGIFEITPSKEIRTNPSPSNDPWFDVPENIEELNRRFERLDSGKAKLIRLSEEQRKELFQV